VAAKITGRVIEVDTDEGMHLKEAKSLHAWIARNQTPRLLRPKRIELRRRLPWTTCKLILRMPTEN